MPDQNTIQTFGTTLSRSSYQNASAFCVRWINHGVEFFGAIPSGEAPPFGVYALAAGACFPLFNKLMCRFERNFQVAHEIQDKCVDRTITVRQQLIKHLVINVVTPAVCIIALNSAISFLSSYQLNQVDALAIVATVIAVRLFLLRPLPPLVLPAPPTTSAPV